MRVDELKADVTYFEECIREIELGGSVVDDIGIVYISKQICQRAIAALKEKIERMER